MHWRLASPDHHLESTTTNYEVCRLNRILTQGSNTCISKFTIIDSDNGLSPGRHQDIIWTNARILLIGPLETNFKEILIEIFTFSFKKMHLKMSFGQWLLFCLSLNVCVHHLSVHKWSTYFYISCLFHSRGPNGSGQLRVMAAVSVASMHQWLCGIGCMHAGTLGFTYMEIHTVKYIFCLNEAINAFTEQIYHLGVRWETSVDFNTYFQQCSDDAYILLHIPLDHYCDVIMGAIAS